MLSRLAAPARGLVPVIARVRFAPRAVAGFHTGVPLRKDEDAPAAAASEDKGGYKVNKDNPEYLPDNWDDFNNMGYKNLAAKGHRGWEDLPAPYKYYHIKLDPADVEKEGFLFKVFTDWRTALPVTALLAVPMYLYDIFVLDERLQLAMIFWSTMAILKVNVGPMIGDTLSQGRQAISDSVYGVESAYRKALTSTIATHNTIMGLDEDLRVRHEAERALKHVEAAAATRAVAVEQVAKMKEMLEYMAMANETAAGAIERNVDSAALAAVSGKLKSDAAFQQASIDDALKALEDASVDTFTSTLGTAYVAALESEVAKAEEGGEDAAAVAARREIFAKKFGFADKVTADMLKGADGDAKAMAVLTAMCGGKAPTAGSAIKFKMPIDY